MQDQRSQPPGGALEPDIVELELQAFDELMPAVERVLELLPTTSRWRWVAAQLRQSILLARSRMEGGG